MQRTSLISLCGASWKCSPRSVFRFAVRSVLLCTIRIGACARRTPLAERAREEAALVGAGLDVDQVGVLERRRREDHRRRDGDAPAQLVIEPAGLLQLAHPVDAQVAGARELLEGHAVADVGLPELLHAPADGPLVSKPGRMRGIFEQSTW